MEHSKETRPTFMTQCDRLNICACIGPVYGEPHCGCEMARRGIPMSEAHLVAIEGFNKSMKQMFADGAFSGGRIVPIREASPPAADSTAASGPPA